jgi:hypothetical protein
LAVSSYQLHNRHLLEYFVDVALQFDERLFDGAGIVNATVVRGFRFALNNWQY